MNSAFRQLVMTTHIQTSDMILVTGDITDKGDIESWKVFWKIISQANLLNRVLIVPGNHDMCCLGLRKPNESNRTLDFEKACAGLILGKQPTTSHGSGILMKV